MKMNKFMRIGVLALLFLMTFAIGFAEDNANDEELIVTLLNQDPDPAISGDYVEIRFQVEKPDSPLLEDISFELLTGYPFSFDDIDSSVKVIDSWAGYGTEGKSEHYVLFYKVRVSENALKGDYDLKLRYNYTKGYRQIGFTKEFTLRVGDETNANLVIGSIKTTPVKLLPDSEENTITFDILNLGAEKAEVVMVELDLPEGFSNSYSYSNVDSLGNIDGDSSAEAMLYVDVDDNLVEGIYDTTLTVKYKNSDENTFRELRLPFSFDVKEKPSFDVSFDEITVSAGSDVSLDVEVLNKGLKTAESISVRAFKDSSQPFSFDEKSDFIGTLETKESGVGVLKLSVDADATAKKYLLDVQVRSIKNDQVFLQEEVIPITVTEQERDGSFIKTALGLVLVLALIVGAYLYGKSKN